MEIFPVDWSACDTGHEDPRFEIRCFGKDADGKDILARIQFTPFFFVKMPVNWSEARVKLFATQSTSKYGAIRTHTVKRTPLLGFTNCAQHDFLQLVFPTLEKFKRAKWNIPKYEKLATFEAALDPLLRFFHVRELSPSSWMTVANARDIGVGADDRVSIPSVREIVVNFKDVGPSQLDRIPRLVMASFDIECVSAKGNFPNPDLPDDVIIAIGTAFQYYGETEPFKKHIVTLGTCDDIDGVEVVRCETEAEVINAWIDEVVARGSDYLVGYNTFGFDFKYISGRANVLVDDLTGNALVHLQKLGKSIEGCGLPVQKNLASSAYGDNSYFYLATPGMTSLDLLQIFKKELKLDTYSLANVSAKYLDNETKLDLKPGHIFEKFKLTSRDRADIAEYCIRDVELPLKLMRRLNTIENTLQMSNATCVPVDYLQFRGQQIRVFSLLTRKARQLGFVAPDTEKMDPAGTEKYEGATVLDAAKGAYFEIVSALDFASLYPSIIRAHCMCPSTIVRNPVYADLEGIEYYSVETGTGTVSFAQGTKNVVPALLEELATFRKNAKKNMGRAKEKGDEFMAGVFDGQQKAYKVSMNSVYGFFGALRGILPLVEMAAAVTATGRAMIEHSKAMAETLVPGTRVIYGGVCRLFDRLCPVSILTQFFTCVQIPIRFCVFLPLTTPRGTIWQSISAWHRTSRTKSHRLSSNRSNWSSRNVIGPTCSSPRNATLGKCTLNQITTITSTSRVFNWCVATTHRWSKRCLTRFSML
jgi:DNA polymerase delta subunit 1